MRILSALLALVMPVWCCAELVVPIKTVDEYVNIRLMPDSKTEIVGHLDQGESVALVGTQDGWYEVVLEGDATGYISADWTVVLDENAVVEWFQPVVEEATDEELIEPEPEVEVELDVQPEPAAEPEIEPEAGI
jgi:hypothetical protein